MALLLFPEGTIVTANTRGISKKYADKTLSRAISSSCLANGSLSVAHLRAIKMKPKS
jgi:hypothetical protein